METCQHTRTHKSLPFFLDGGVSRVGGWLGNLREWEGTIIGNNLALLNAEKAQYFLQSQ